MSDYAIGDIQGCYDPLLRLLAHIQFDDRVDRLWFVGDLVNRGPQSLAVLRFIKQLAIPARITLGNHDLHLLARFFCADAQINKDDTLDEVLAADDAEELCHWLRQQPILIHDESLNMVMCHAGIAPMWSLSQAKQYALELEHVLSGFEYQHFLSHLYGNFPNYWSDQYTGIERLRIITNYFTRMRFCDRDGRLMLKYKGSIDKAPADLIPWFSLPNRKPIEADIVFGHWASLDHVHTPPNIYAIDSGSVWGGPLTALRLQDRQRFSV